MAQFVLECVELSGTGEDDLVTPRSPGLSQFNIPWDHPYPYFQGMVPAMEEEDLETDVVECRREGRSSLRQARPSSGETTFTSTKSVHSLSLFGICN